MSNPYPQDIKKIKIEGKEYLRVDSGEYRIIYRTTTAVLTLVLIDKRNDDRVYKALRRKC